MQVILTRQQVQELIEKIEANYQEKGAALHEQAKKKAGRLNRRIRKLGDWHFDLTLNTDLIENIVRFERRRNPYIEKFKREEINFLKTEETPCKGFKKLKGLLSSELSEQIIISDDELKRFEWACERKFHENDFCDLESKRAEAKMRLDEIISDLRFVKEKTGRYPIRKESGTKDVRGKFERRREEYQSERRYSSNSFIIALLFGAFFGGLAAFMIFS